MHGRNFLAGSAGVNRHGAILGMQMQCNKTQLSFRGASETSEPEDLEVPGSLRAPERLTAPVNAFLTINWAKIAG